MSEHDELGPWADEALLRALRAPGSPGELAREQEYAAAYREAVRPDAAPIPLPRRAARRLGAGGTAVVVAITLSGGAAAAAYTGNLPDPVQEIAHSVIGAPAPDGASEPDARAADPTRGASPGDPDPGDPDPGESEAGESDPGESAAPSAAPSPTGPASGPSPSPSGEPDTGGGRPSSDPDPSTTPSDQPGAGPSTPPTPPPPPAPPATATITASAHAVGYGGSILLTGRLSTAAGEPAAGRRVALQVQRARGGWAIVTKTVSAGDGTVSATSLPVTGLARYRWRAVGVHSRSWRLRVEASLSAAADVGAEQTTITGTTVGANAGDAVVLVALVRRQPVVVGRAQVAGDGTVAFTFRTPARKRAFSVRLLPTPDHTAAKTRLVVVSPRSPAPEPSPSAPG